MTKTRTYKHKSVYLADAEYAAIKAKLAGSGHSFSGFCRGLLSQGHLVNQRSIPVEQFRELSAIGNNLNQLTRVANQTRGIPAILLSLLNELRQQLHAIREALE